MFGGEEEYKAVMGEENKNRGDGLGEVKGA